MNPQRRDPLAGAGCLVFRYPADESDLIQINPEGGQFGFLTI
jgi:hypothetical protein